MEWIIASYKCPLCLCLVAPEDRLGHIDYHSKHMAPDEIPAYEPSSIEVRRQGEAFIPEDEDLMNDEEGMGEVSSNVTSLRPASNPDTVTYMD